jgi:hypothetical protein
LRYELFPGLRLANGLALEPVINDPDNPEASLLDRNGTYNKSAVIQEEKMLITKPITTTLPRMSDLHMLRNLKRA